ncbi:hypothetical protein N8T08_010733 [Aspergillus melleus]|uniref:Uncharacterized protein n=1 Tax=Aspergillus melleus TaxID=138277 RepID=A0ACC3BCA1_9EURO|nr:hypothetical protein N8T08_010733 [Aspergillus melleus]
MHEAWSSFGIIVRQAQALRLQRKSTAPCTNHVDYEYRKRVFWSIYTYDRILSSIFGRPCALHDDDIDQEECALANDEGITVSECRTLEQGNFCSAAALIHYAQLARMLGRILREFYSPVAKRYSFHTLQQMASEIERDLGDWQDNLPVYLNYVSLPSSAMSTMTQRQTCTLKLTFAHTMLLLYRPFLLHWIRASDQISTNLESWFKHCGNKSVEAASMVVAECRDLYERGLFSRLFWLVNYVQFASIGTLYMYSCLWPHSSNVRATADEALAQFPTGVEGDLVGQRYLEILKELQEVTKGFNIGNVALDDQTILQSGDSFANEMPVFDGMLMSYGDPWGVGLFEATSLIDSL